MHRLASFDVSRRFVRPEMRFFAKIAFGLAIAGATIGFMYALQRWTRLPGPFAFVFPAVLIATLYGHWQAGVVALTASMLWIWHFILPNPAAFEFLLPTSLTRAVTTVAVALTIMLLAEIFRRNVERATRDRDREIARREMLLRELEHRTRNNFALVASLLQFQQRQSDSPDVKHALDGAINRVHTFSDAFSQLAIVDTDQSDIDMKDYLSGLIDRFSDALFGEKVRIETNVCDLTLPSEKAVAVGLYVNEALINCAKYAFPDGRCGAIKIELGIEGNGWRLTVLDDGIGMGQQSETDGCKRGGLGSVLFEALATQAGARHQLTFPELGRRLDLVSKS